MNYSFLSKTLLFRGANEETVREMLGCLDANTKAYEKGQAIYRAGDLIDRIGVVLSGSVRIESSDIFGNSSILSRVDAGEIFGETYALIPGEPLMVDVIAASNAEVLFLNTARLVTTCSAGCAHHQRLIKNLLQITAEKNLALSRKILHTAPKSIRSRLLSYFSEQVMKNGSLQFTIPFNRQELSDYLGVDRSALSNELSKMQADGLISYQKNTFIIRQPLS